MAIELIEYTYNVFGFIVVRGNYFALASLATKDLPKMTKAGDGQSGDLHARTTEEPGWSRR